MAIVKSKTTRTSYRSLYKLKGGDDVISKYCVFLLEETKLLRRGLPRPSQPRAFIIWTYIRDHAANPNHSTPTHHKKAIMLL